MSEKNICAKLFLEGYKNTSNIDEFQFYCINRIKIEQSNLKKEINQLKNDFDEFKDDINKNMYELIETIKCLPIYGEDYKKAKIDFKNNISTKD